MNRPTTVALTEHEYELVIRAAKQKKVTPLLFVRRAIHSYIYLKGLLDRDSGSTIVILDAEGRKLRDINLP